MLKKSEIFWVMKGITFDFWIFIFHFQFLIFDFKFSDFQIFRFSDFQIFRFSDFRFSDFQIFRFQIFKLSESQNLRFQIRNHCRIIETWCTSIQLSYLNLIRNYSSTIQPQSYWNILVCIVSYYLSGITRFPKFM